MKFAIIDDSVQDRELLKGLLERYCTENHLHAEISLYRDGMAFLKDEQRAMYDIVFLDIYMESITGMETAERLRGENITSLLIFCTQSEDHAVKGYRVRAFDYLLKPLNASKINETMRLCIKKIKKEAHYIEVKEGRGPVKVLLRDIYYTDYFNHYIQIHTKERLVRSYMPFREFSPLLLCYPQFLCCYRNCVINMDEVERLSDTDFTLKNGERIPISRSLRADVRKIFAEHLFQKLERGEKG